MTDERPRLGIYGGTFDPPHRGHLEVARAARDELHLDRVLFIPAPAPPHKDQVMADPADRERMVQILIEGNPGLAVLPVEKELPPPHYTVRTLEHLSRTVFPGASLFLIIGADSHMELHLWREYPKLFDLATVVAVSRPGYDGRNPALGDELDRRVVRLNRVHVPLSSTELRESLNRGEAHPDVLPAVLAYIRKRGLYVS